MFFRVWIVLFVVAAAFAWSCGAARDAIGGESCRVPEPGSRERPGCCSVVYRPDDEVAELIRAAGRGDDREVQRLLRDGVDPNERRRFGASCPNALVDGEAKALGVALEGGHRSVAEILLEHGAEPEAHDFGDAAIGGGEALVRLLLDYGADPNMTDEIGATPLWWVLARSPSLEPARLLVDRGADITARVDGKTLLVHAAERCDSDELVFVMEWWGAIGRDELDEAMAAAAAAGCSQLTEILTDRGDVPLAPGEKHASGRCCLHPAAAGGTAL